MFSQSLKLFISPRCCFIILLLTSSSFVCLAALPACRTAISRRRQAEEQSNRALGDEAESARREIDAALEKEALARDAYNAAKVGCEGEDGCVWL